MTTTAKTPVLLVGTASRPRVATWAIFGVAPGQFTMVGIRILLNGHVRGCLGGHLYLRKGQLVKNNADLIKQTAKIIRAFTKNGASVVETWKILPLPGRK